VKKEISTANAPSAIGPYSQGIKNGNMIFLSGQLGINPRTKELVSGGVEAETHQIFKNIQSILKEEEASLDNIVKVTVLLKDMGDFKKVNEVYPQYFNKPYPARSAFAVRELPLSVSIEIEVIAMK
jgi:2-iminobutanoate/2-iminopropanoate deaminase